MAQEVQELLPATPDTPIDVSTGDHLTEIPEHNIEFKKSENLEGKASPTLERNPGVAR